MRTLPRPAMGVRAVMCASVGNIQDQNLSQKLLSVVELLVSREGQYEGQGSVGALYQLPTSDSVGGQVTTAEMKWMYETKMARDGQPGRPFYDLIRASAPNGICPTCAQRTVSTLDHYLPKSAYPDFAITPLNLFPSCADCNKIKLTHQANTPGDQTLHPYFDDVEDAIWLVANVIQTVPPAAMFAVAPPHHWPLIKQQRVTTHFNILGLAALYGANAAQELTQIASRLSRIADTAGPDGVREHLQEEAVSRRVPAKNSWQAALYSALAQSEWFWTGGHRHI